MKARLAIVAAAVLLGSCHKDGGASSCNFVGGPASYTSTDGSVSDVYAVSDSNLATLATAYTGSKPDTEIHAGAAGAPDFPAGSNAGAFITPPNGSSDTDFTITTFEDMDSQIKETATGAALTLTPTNAADPATYYVSFNTTLPFNGVKLTLKTTNSTPYLVYEFCGSATVPGR